MIAQDLEAAPANPDAATAAYDIGYDQPSDRFVFHFTTTAGATVTASDALPASVTIPTTDEVIDLTHTGAWVYLAAIYDHSAGTIRLDAVHELNHDPLTARPGLGLEVSVTPQPVSLAGRRWLGVWARSGSATGPERSTRGRGLVDNVSVWQKALTDTGADNQVDLNAMDDI